MLERASASAECTSHILLRSFEAPIRSRRTLEPAFWRHGGDRLDVPAWWPIYLNKIRTQPPIYSVFPEQNSTSVLEIPSQRSTRGDRRMRTPSTPASRHVSSYSTHIPPRPSRTPLRGHAASASSRTVELAPSSNEAASQQTFGDDQSIRNKSGVNALGNETSRKIERPPKHQVRGSKYNTNNGLKESQGGYAEAWALFTQSGQKEELASGMLHFMAGSPNRQDQNRALTAFGFIPDAARVQVDYSVALDAAVKMHRYKFAASIVNHAVRRRLGAEVFFKLVVHCIEYTLWNTLAALWNSIGSARVKDLVRQRSRSPNIAGEYTSYFDNIVDFPGKMVSLAERLSNHDAVLALNRTLLVEICKRLVYVAVENQHVMSIITGPGCVALFNIQKLLQFDSRLHLAALATIARMPDRGTKSQLAMLIYRNYRFSNPDSDVPRWVFGSLIGISADARQRVTVFDFILEELQKLYGQVDEWSYQQIMAALASQGEFKALNKVFQQYIHNFKPKDAHDVNHLLYVHAVVGDAENTQAQFDRLRTDFGIEPDVISWTNLVLAHARSSHPETTFEIFDAMRLNGAVPNGVTWSILMSIAAKKGDTRRVRSLYESAKKAGVATTMHMTGALVESLLLNDEVVEAQEVVLRESRGNPRQSSVRLWNSLFRYHAFKADSSSIQKLEALMKKNAVEPDSMTYAALMTALVVQKRTMDAIKVLRALHFNHRISPSEFHYSILIHGFVMEGKRDLAIVTYHEMLQRFPRVTPSAKLAMLNLQLQRDASRARSTTKAPSQDPAHESQASTRPEPWYALDLLSEVLVQNHRADSSSPLPNPGFRRSSSRQGMESMYYGSIVTFLQSQGSFKQSELLLAKSNESVPAQTKAPELQIRNLTFEMNIKIHEQKWAEVSSIWEEILDLGQRVGTSFKNIHKPTSGISRSVTTGMRSHDVNESDDEQTMFKSMLPLSIVPSVGNKVLSSQQFLLSWPFSLLMQSLDARNLHDELIMAVSRLERLGFALNNHNLNRYIQILTKSSDLSHGLLAFKLFEDKMITDGLTWDSVRRGKWQTRIQKRTRVARADASSRGPLVKSNPALYVPSYFTMIHLAMTLMKSSQVAERDKFHLRAIQLETPRTYNLIKQTPYSRDRVQGVLLRGHAVKGDREPRPKMSQQLGDVSVIQGSKSPLDRVPSQLLGKIEGIVTPRDGQRARGASRNSDPTASIESRWAHFQRLAAAQLGSALDETQSQSSNSQYERRAESQTEKLQDLIGLAEQVFGEVIRTPQYRPNQGRTESAAEVKARVQVQELAKLELLETASWDMKGHVSVSDPYRGQSAIQSMPHNSIHSYSAASGNARSARVAKWLRSNPKSKFVIPKSSNQRSDTQSRRDAPQVDTRPLTRQVFSRSKAKAATGKDPVHPVQTTANVHQSHLMNTEKVRN